MDLKEIRQDIDLIDSQIVSLLEERMDLISKVIEYKIKNNIDILDSKRESDLLEKIAKQISNPAYTETISRTFEDIMKHSKEYQKEVSYK